MSHKIESEITPAGDADSIVGQEAELNLEAKKFILERVPSVSETVDKGEGFIYILYFSSQEEAEKAATDFWNTREGSEMARRSLKSGMLKPFAHEITCGDRTTPMRINKHPEKPFMVIFNGNTTALSAKGEAALKKLGYIE